MDHTKVKNIRLRLGWSQSDLARRLGQDSAFIAALEAGEQEMDSWICSELEIIERQADQCSEEVVVHTLAEVVLDEQALAQVANNEVDTTI